MAGEEKIRENRLRATARRRGYGLSKSRRRDPLATDYGRWSILDATGAVVAHCDDLDCVENFLDQEAKN